MWEETGPILLTDGRVQETPSDDKVAPSFSRSVLSSRSPFPLIEADLATEEAKVSSAPSVNAKTPKRAGVELNAPPPQQPRTLLDAAGQEGDEAFRLDIN